MIMEATTPSNASVRGWTRHPPEGPVAANSVAQSMLNKASASSAADGVFADSTASCAANAAAAFPYWLLSITWRTALAIAAEVARLPRRIPAPNRCTGPRCPSDRDPAGGKPVAPRGHALITVPWPACVTTTAASGRMSACGTARSTRTFRGVGTSPGSTARPVVITPNSSRPTPAVHPPPAASPQPVSPRRPKPDRPTAVRCSARSPATRLAQIKRPAGHHQNPIAPVEQFENTADRRNPASLLTDGAVGMNPHPAASAEARTVGSDNTSTECPRPINSAARPISGGSVPPPSMVARRKRPTLTSRTVGLTMARSSRRTSYRHRLLVAPHIDPSDR